MSCQSRFDARYWMLGAGALGRPRGMVWGGRREESSRWGTHVYLWWIHFDIWQNQYNNVKFKNLKKKKKKAEHRRTDVFELWCWRRLLRLQGDQTSQSWRKSVLNIHWKGWCWSWSSNTFWPPNVKNWLIGKDPDANMSLSKLLDLVMDSKAWHAAVNGFAKIRAWLSDWTELNWGRKRLKGKVIINQEFCLVKVDLMWPFHVWMAFKLKVKNINPGFGKSLQFSDMLDGWVGLDYWYNKFIKFEETS